MFIRLTFASLMILLIKSLKKVFTAIKVFQCATIMFYMWLYIVHITPSFIKTVEGAKTINANSKIL